jgi:VIT1/CCC1 family predicted Fe2+/Mn2+ transporter
VADALLRSGRDADEPDQPARPTDQPAQPADQPVDQSTDQNVDGAPHEGEAHGQGIGARLNWLRAGVLGANDGIVSTAGIVIGVAAATTDRAAIVTAGVAGLAAGAMSMAAGEYVSVSTQRDTERALLAKERRELREMPEEELAELTQIYRDKGLTEELAAQVAAQLTAHDALTAHAEAELGIDPDELTNPWHAAWASMGAFTAGALLPLIAILLPPAAARVWVTAVAVAVALALTGWGSARLGGAPVRPAVLRNVGGGVLAMVVTYGIGALVGTQL